MFHCTRRAGECKSIPLRLVAGSQKSRLSFGGSGRSMPVRRTPGQRMRFRSVLVKSPVPRTITVCLGQEIVGDANVLLTPQAHFLIPGNSRKAYSENAISQPLSLPGKVERPSLKDIVKFPSRLLWSNYTVHLVMDLTHCRARVGVDQGDSDDTLFRGRTGRDPLRETAGTTGDNSQDSAGECLHCEDKERPYPLL